MTFFSATNNVCHSVGEWQLTPFKYFYRLVFKLWKMALKYSAVEIWDEKSKAIKNQTHYIFSNAVSVAVTKSGHKTAGSHQESSLELTLHAFKANDTPLRCFKICCIVNAQKRHILFYKLLTATHRNVADSRHSVIINKFWSEMCHRKFITKVLENAFSAHNVE